MCVRGRQVTRVSWICLTIRTNCRLRLVESSDQYGKTMSLLVLSFVNRSHFERFLLSAMCSTLAMASGDLSIMRRYLL